VWTAELGCRFFFLHLLNGKFCVHKLVPEREGRLARVGGGRGQKSLVFPCVEFDTKVIGAHLFIIFTHQVKNHFHL
jgi:hypothetical protein